MGHVIDRGISQSGARLNITNYAQISDQKVNILLVDDQPNNSLKLEAVLACPGYNLVRAASVRQALKYLLRQEFAVILLDVKIPNLGKLRPTGLIKIVEKSRNIPIVLMTTTYNAINVFESVIRRHSLGAVYYIFKPFDPEVLKQKIADFVSMYRYKRLLETLTRELVQARARLEQEIKEREKLTEVLHKIIQAVPCPMSIRSLRNGRWFAVNQSWL